MQNMQWYETLIKPALTPPPYIFGTVWPILYFLIAASLFAFLIKSKASYRYVGIIPFLLQLLLNLMWSPVFFGMQNISGALMILSLLLIATTTTILTFYKASKLAASLLIPYFLWLLFAWYLNFAIWQMN